MSIGYSNKIEDKTFNFSHYIKKRIITIYPLHLIGFILSIPLTLLSIWQRGYLTISDFSINISNLFLVQSWIPLKKYYFSANQVSWFLCDICFFYLIYPYLYKYLICFSKKRLISTLLITIIFYFLTCFFIAKSFQHSILYINPLFRLIDAILGIILFQFFLKEKHSRLCFYFQNASFFKKTIIEIFVWIPLVLISLYYNNLPFTFRIACIHWIPILLLLMTYTYLDKYQGALSRIFHSKIIVQLGDLSFTFFILHQLILRSFTIIENKYQINTSNVLTVFLLLIGTLLLSFIVKNHIQMPLESHLKRRYL